MQTLDREPCPWRVIDDVGGAFAFGAVGGSVWHSIGGARNAPKGSRMSGAFTRVRARVPMLAGSFAVWGIVYACCDCTITAIRRKEDPWNAIASGAATGGILAMRAGFKAASRSALTGGVLLAAIEGLGIVMNRMLMPWLERHQMKAIPGMVDTLEPPSDPLFPRIKTMNARHNQALRAEGPGKTEALLAAGEGPQFGSGNYGLGADNNSTDSIMGVSGMASPGLWSMGVSGTSSDIVSGQGASSQWDAPGFTAAPSSSSSAAQPTPAAPAAGSSWRLW